MQASKRTIGKNSRRRGAAKSLGQHFLVDPGVVRELVDAAHLSLTSQVLEIGPGHGAITYALAGQVPQGLVLAVEKDRYLGEQLRERMKSKRHVKVVIGDILATPLAALLAPPYQIVANLPFAITSPVLTKFLLGDYRGRAGEVIGRPERMTVIVQADVAERLTAQPGSRERGILTVLLELFGQPRLVARVPATAFRPQPAVDAAILDVVLAEPVVPPGQFLSLLKAGFANRRRQIHNSLAGSLHLSTSDAKALLDAARIDPQARAEELTIKHWLALLAALRAGR